MKKIILILSLFLVGVLHAQEAPRKFRFGGGLNLSFGDTTIIGISPEVIYQANKYVYFGGGIGYQYVKNRYTNYNIYSFSLISLVNPMDKLQLSAKLEQSFVRGERNYSPIALFIGAGYQVSPNVSVGVEYDVLFDKNKSIYSSPIAPFVRVYF